MSQPSNQELVLLGRVADDLREVFVERGHQVEHALETDPAFGSGWSRSALTRDLVLAAVSDAASRVGVDYRSVNRGGRELRYFEEVDRRYRVRRGHRDATGNLIVQSSADSALATTPDELFEIEQWAFVWTISPMGQIEEVLAAEVVGFVEGRPGHLRLDRVLALGRDDTAPGRFLPTDEGLDMFDEDDRDEDGGEFGSSAS